jgi:hypothetical protein
LLAKLLPGCLRELPAKSLLGCLGKWLAKLVLGRLRELLVELLFRCLTEVRTGYSSKPLTGSGRSRPALGPSHAGGRYQERGNDHYQCLHNLTSVRSHVAYSTIYV